MMKGLFLLAALLGVTVLGTGAATRQPPADPPDFGSCRYYCGAHSYTTLGQCAAACGGAGNCDQIC